MVRRNVILSLSGERDKNMAVLVQTACSYSSRIHLSYGTKRINAKSIMGVMALDLEDGDSVCIEADGADELAASEAVAAFLND